MAHNNPFYEEGKEPSFCSVCGSKMAETTVNGGFDESTGIEIKIPARICLSEEGKSHGIRVQREKTKIPPPPPPGIYGDSPSKKITLIEFLFGR